MILRGKASMLLGLGKHHRLSTFGIAKGVQ